MKTTTALLALLATACGAAGGSTDEPRLVAADLPTGRYYATEVTTEDTCGLDAVGEVETRELYYSGGYLDGGLCARVGNGLSCEQEVVAESGGCQALVRRTYTLETFDGMEYHGLWLTRITMLTCTWLDSCRLAGELTLLGVD